MTIGAALTPSRTERLIALDGAFNFRDTGGYRAATGRTRWGKLYRADALAGLDERDRARLAALGLGIVIDLRDEDERSFAPSRLEGLGARVEHVPVLTRPSRSFLAEDASLTTFYRHVVEHSGARITRALAAIAGSGSTPTVVHCTAGKDRTGLVVAFALLLTGVDRDDVVADYAATADNLPAALLDTIVARLRAEHAHPGIHLDELVRLSPAPVLEQTIDLIVERFGSVEDYAVQHGLTDADLASLHDVLIEPPAE